VKEVVVPLYVQAENVTTPNAFAEANILFARVSDNELLGYGVPAEWLDDVKKATEDTLLILTDHLPAEAAEALLELATGGKPRLPQPAAATSPFDHPDAQRRFRVVSNVEELQRALDFPWEKWTVFLHPEQKEWVERDYAGPARVSGSFLDPPYNSAVFTLIPALKFPCRSPSRRHNWMLYAARAPFRIAAGHT